QGVCDMPGVIVARGSYKTRRLPASRLTRNSTRKITKQIFAMPADAAAIPPKPNSAARSAITRNTHAYQSMCFPPPKWGCGLRAACYWVDLLAEISYSRSMGWRMDVRETGSAE